MLAVGLGGGGLGVVGEGGCGKVSEDWLLMFENCEIMRRAELPT